MSLRHCWARPTEPLLILLGSLHNDEDQCRKEGDNVMKVDTTKDKKRRGESGEGISLKNILDFE